MRGIGQTSPAEKAKERVVGGKGEHGSKGGAGRKGTQQVENSVMDEDQENITAMTSEEKEKKHWEDVRKLLEMVEKEEMELEMMQAGRNGARRATRPSGA